ncbi:MAG: TPM domain-containing protein [Campylobacterales bacterium]|nr:TPM domain-containing protein [Campylobacterales bacterium]
MQFYKRCSRLWAAAFFLVFSCGTLSASMVLVNEGIIGERAVEKMNLLGRELRQKSGISVYAVAVKSLGGKAMAEMELDLSEMLVSPYALLMLSQEDKQVNILTSGGTEAFFDKDGVLSPYPWSGTILPLLTTKKGSDNYTAALLNGYADIVEQIADTQDIVLENAIGSANKNTINILRIVVYATLAWAVLLILYRRRKYKHASNNP